jgi:hypothetical protein
MDTPYLVVTEIKRRGRPPATPEQREAARKRKNVRNKAYYEAHREEQNEKAKGRYDPIRKLEYYKERRDEILARERQQYKARKNAEKVERLEALLIYPAVSAAAEALLECVDDITLGDVSSLEKTVILTQTTNHAV